MKNELKKFDLYPTYLDQNYDSHDLLIMHELNKDKEQPYLLQQKVIFGKERINIDGKLYDIPFFDYWYLSNTNLLHFNNNFEPKKGFNLCFSSSYGFNKVSKFVKLNDKRLVNTGVENGVGNNYYVYVFEKPIFNSRVYKIADLEFVFGFKKENIDFNLKSYDKKIENLLTKCPYMMVSVKSCIDFFNPQDGEHSESYSKFFKYVKNNFNNIAKSKLTFCNFLNAFQFNNYNVSLSKNVFNQRIEFWKNFTNNLIRLPNGINDLSYDELELGISKKVQFDLNERSLVSTFYKNSTNIPFEEQLPIYVIKSFKNAIESLNPNDQKWKYFEGDIINLKNCFNDLEVND
jgi:hypothetical protein